MRVSERTACMSVCVHSWSSLSLCPCGTWSTLPTGGFSVCWFHGAWLDVLVWLLAHCMGWTFSLGPGSQLVKGWPASSRVNFPLPLVLWDSLSPFGRVAFLRGCRQEVWPQVYGTLGSCGLHGCPGSISVCLWLLGALLRLYTFIIKYIWDKDTDTPTLSLSHSHYKKIVDLDICVFSNFCVPRAVCLFFLRGAAVGDCVFLFALYPFITSTGINNEAIFRFFREFFPL